MVGAGLLSAGVLVAVAGPGGAGATTVVAAPPTSVTLTVHGYGHGEGMGQYGALGYALNQRFTYQQILSHYYGALVDGADTTLGSLSAAAAGTTGLVGDSSPITVDITAGQGSAVTVTSASSFTVTAGALATPITVPGGGAAQFELGQGGSSPTTWSVFVSTDASANACTAGAVHWGSAVATGVSAPTATPVTPAPFPAAGSLLQSQTLQLCQTGDYYRGSLTGTVSASSPTVAQTVNTLPLGQYVADSAAAESPGDWGSDGGPGPQGQPIGFQQTEAQTVATRSYAVAQAVEGGYDGVADICDTTACQAYPGVSDENAYDDLAVADTANQVVLLPSGAVALTEYSASTGGYSAPGSGPDGFAGVVDAGDAVCTPQVCNPYHSYTATIAASAIEAAFPQIGTYTSLQVVQRNGLGDLGGRVVEMTITGTAGSTTVTGNAFAAAVAGDASDQLDTNGGTYTSSGILSNWFALQGQPTSSPGYWLLGSDGGIFSFGSARFYGSMGGTVLNKPVVGMAAVPGGGGYWEVASDGGLFSFGSARFYGSMGGTVLNKPVVGMAAVPGGGGYWEVASDGGIFAFGNAGFYGSTGGITLAQPIVAMAATPDGKGYWLLAADGGLFAFGDAGYYGSLPGSGINARAVALLPSADGNGYLIVEASGAVVPYGDAVSLGDVTTAVPGYTGTLVGGAATS